MNTKTPVGKTGDFFVKAVIDVGTNSVKLLVAKFGNNHAGSDMETLADIVVVSRLGGGSADNGVLSREAMERTAAVISDLRAEARKLGADNITAVGTHALRTASNAGDFISMAENACGVSVRVISEEEEAELSFEAAISCVGDNFGGEILVLDVGGGSSEIVMGRGGAIMCRRSVPVGALSLFKKIFVTRDGVISDNLLNEAGRHVNAAFNESFIPRDFDFRNVSSCAGIGGTITTLAAVSAARSGEARVGGMELDISEIERQIIMYASTDMETRKKIPGLPADRADIILPGACIVKSFMRMSSLDKIIACDRGLRHGVMLRA